MAVLPSPSAAVSLQPSSSQCRVKRTGTRGISRRYSSRSAGITALLAALSSAVRTPNMVPLILPSM